MPVLIYVGAKYFITQDGLKFAYSRADQDRDPTTMRVTVPARLAAQPRTAPPTRTAPRMSSGGDNPRLTDYYHYSRKSAIRAAWWTAVRSITIHGMQPVERDPCPLRTPHEVIKVFLPWEKEALQHELVVQEESAATYDEILRRWNQTYMSVTCWTGKLNMAADSDSDSDTDAQEVDLLQWECEYEGVSAEMVNYPHAFPRKYCALFK